MSVSGGLPGRVARALPRASRTERGAAGRVALRGVRGLPRPRRADEELGKPPGSPGVQNLVKPDPEPRSDAAAVRTSKPGGSSPGGFGRGASGSGASGRGASGRDAPLEVALGVGTRGSGSVARHWASAWIWGLAGGLYPELCALCRAPLARHGGCREHRLPPRARGPRCERCAARLPGWLARVEEAPRGEGARGKQLCHGCRRKPPRLARVHVAGDYRAGSGVLREWCLRFKHGGRADLAGELGWLLGESWAEARAGRGWPADALVPVPLHWTRRARRGYDQAALLAEVVAQRCGVPLVPALRRRRRTAPQGSAGGGARRANVAGAFALRSRAARRIAGRHVWLVDDVATSLATAEACARVLRAGGARSVSLLALARAEFRGGNPRAGLD
jgi:ComF family protein